MKVLKVIKVFKEVRDYSGNSDYKKKTEGRVLSVFWGGYLSVPLHPVVRLAKHLAILDTC